MIIAIRKDGSGHIVIRHSIESHPWEVVVAVDNQEPHTHRPADRLPDNFGRLKTRRIPASLRVHG